VTVTSTVASVMVTRDAVCVVVGCTVAIWVYVASMYTLQNALASACSRGSWNSSQTGSFAHYRHEKSVWLVVCFPERQSSPGCDFLTWGRDGWDRSVKELLARGRAEAWRSPPRLKKSPNNILWVLSFYQHRENEWLYSIRKVWSRWDQGFDVTK
jgi:hypothetical protein